MPSSSDGNSNELGPLGIDYLNLYECEFAEAQAFGIILFLSWILYLIFLLGNTAENYLSPTLALLCDKLNLSYNVAGITFLAFGNGAPDVFSLVASFSNVSVDKDIGIGALLGAGMFVTTVVVGTVCIIRPGQVQPHIYLRDVIFYLVSVFLLAVIVTAGSINFFFSFILFAIYGLYVVLVIFNILPNSSINPLMSDNNDNEEDEDDVGKNDVKGNSNRNGNNISQAAFWHPDGDRSLTSSSSGVELSNLSTLANANANPLSNAGTDVVPGKFISTRLTNSKRGGYSFMLVDDIDDKSDDEDTKINDRNSHDDRSKQECVNSNSNGGLDLENGKLSFSGVIVEDHFGSGSNSNDQDDLSDDLSLSRGLLEDNEPRRPHRGSSLADTLMWHQWIIRRRLQKHISESQFWELSLLSQILVVIESPFTFCRDVTIPSCDESVWYKPYAIIQSILAPQLLLIAFDVASNSNQAFIITFFLSCAPATGIYLLTKASSTPDDAVFGLIWTFCGFCMCVCWIYLFAEELVTCLNAVGKIFSISPGILGLTLLAWGNSVGDFFSNISVAKRGRCEMAIAGCYAGPAFNVLVGLGISFLIVTARQFPNAYHVKLDEASTLSVIFLFFVLLSSILIIVLRDYKIDQYFGIYLIVMYGFYTTLQIILLILQVEHIE